MIWGTDVVDRVRNTALAIRGPGGGGVVVHKISLAYVLLGGEAMTPSVLLENRYPDAVFLRGLREAPFPNHSSTSPY